MRAIGGWLAGTWRENWLFILVIGGILGAFVFLRTPASAVESVAEVDALGSRRWSSSIPTLEPRAFWQNLSWTGWSVT